MAFLPHPILQKIAGLCIASTAASAQPAPTFTDLGYLPGAVSSFGQAISGDGEVVAGTSGGSAMFHAFLWTSAGGLQDIGTLAGDAIANMSALNADGSVAVGLSNTGTAYHPFRWTVPGGMQLIPGLPGSDYSDLADISDDGSIACGGSRISNLLHGFRWTSATGVQPVPSLPGDTGSFCDAVSANGQVIAGGSIRDTFPLAQERACRWIDMNVEEYALPKGAMNSRCRALSADGSIGVGFSDSFLQGFRAIRWTSPGLAQDLGTLPGDSLSQAVVTNANGTAVAGWSSGSEWRAFLWTSALGMVDLNAYLPSLGVDLMGLTLSEVNGISADGTAITGNARRGAENHAWVVTGLPFPCRVDFNRDSAVNSADFFEFLTAFFAPDISADFNDDDVVNSQDFFDFLTAFFVGC